MNTEHRWWLILAAILVACGGRRGPAETLPAGETRRAVELIIELPSWQSQWVEGELTRPASVEARYRTTASTLVQMDPGAVRAAFADALAWSRDHDRVLHAHLQARLYAVNRLLFDIPPDLVEPDRDTVGWKTFPPAGAEYRKKPLAWPVEVDGRGRVIRLATHTEPTWYRAVEEFDDFRGRFSLRTVEALTSSR